jgi:hypothetical protein
MLWDKPFELTHGEYKDTFDSLKIELFEVAKTEQGIFISRKTSNEIIFLHFYPYQDIMNYSGQNEKDTYYQTGDILEEEYKAFEELNTRITLNDPTAVQVFLNEVIRLQKEYYDNMEE